MILLLSNDEERALVHKYWIKGNGRLCLEKMEGKCDKLGQNPNEYPETIKWVTLYEFLYPFIVFLIWIALTLQVDFSALFSVYSAIFIPFFPLFIESNLVVSLVLLTAGIVVELIYFGYLFKQTGIYALIPIGAFISQICLIFIPYIGAVLGAFLGLVPWSLIAIGIHFVHYEVGIGIMFNTEEKCYVQNIDKGEFHFEW